MADELTLEIVTPAKVLLETKADYVPIPGVLGEMGILPGHIPLLSDLKSGVLSYKSGSEEMKYAVHYGYAEIHKDKITILANEAETSDEIDAAGAKTAEVTLQGELEQAVKDSADQAAVNRLQQGVFKEVTRQEMFS